MNKLKTLLIVTLAIGLVTVFAGAASAADHYVDINDKSAVDQVGAGSRNTPFASLSYALTQAVDGDTIYVDDGLYDTYITTGATDNVESFPITIDQGVTIRYRDYHDDPAGAPEGAIFHASGTNVFEINNGESESVTLNGDDPNTTEETEALIKVSGATDTNSYGLEVLEHNDQPIKVKNVVFEGNYTAVSHNDISSAAFTFENNLLLFNDANGLVFYKNLSSNGATIQGNLFEGSGEAALLFTGTAMLDPGSATVKIYHNTFDNNQAAIKFEDGSLDSDINPALNEILSSNSNGIINNDADMVYGDYNWWGDKEGPATGFNTNLDWDSTQDYLGHPLNSLKVLDSAGDPIDDPYYDTFADFSNATVNWTVNGALTDASSDYTIVVGDGTYSDTMSFPITVGDSGLTIEADDGASPVIDSGTSMAFNIQEEATLKGLKVTSTATNPIVDVVTADSSSLTKNIFELNGDYGQLGLRVYNSSGVTVEENDFVGNNSAAGLKIANLPSAAGATVKNNSFSDLAYGVQFLNHSGTGTRTVVEGNDFSGMVDPVPTDSWFDGAAVKMVVSSTANIGMISVVDNEIKDSSYGIAAVDAGPTDLGNTLNTSSIDVKFNNISGNSEKGVYIESDVDLETDTSGTINLDATHNWWGADSDPSPSGDDKVSDNVLVDPWLGASVEAAKFSPSGSDLSSDEVGVEILSDIGTAEVGIAKYSSNPRGNFSNAWAFYDVYAGATSSGGSVDIRFYSDAKREPFYWSGAGEWLRASEWTYSSGNEWVFVDVSGSGTQPETSDLSRLEFALGSAGPGPTAEFTADTSDTLEVEFTASESGLDSYEWEFGDGSATGSGETTTHMYSSADTYSVTLTVTDGGVEDSVTKDITVGQEASFSVNPGNSTPAGEGAWSLVSMPVHPDNTDPKDVFDPEVPDTDTLYLWEYDNGSWNTVQDGNLTSVDSLGGYYFWQPDGTTLDEISLTGDALEGNQSIDLGAAGWQLFGVPYEVNWSDDGTIGVSDGTNNYNLVDAVNAGWINNTIWELDGGGTFTETTVSEGKTLDPGKGYWIYTQVNGLTMTFSKSGGPSGGPPTPTAAAINLDKVEKVESHPPMPMALGDLSVDSLQVKAVSQANSVTFRVSGEGAPFVNGVKVEVLDPSGRRLKSLESGGNTVNWSTADVANGVYLYMAFVDIEGSFSQTNVGKVLVLK